MKTQSTQEIHESPEWKHDELQSETDLLQNIAELVQNPWERKAIPSHPSSSHSTYEIQSSKGKKILTRPAQKMLQSMDKMAQLNEDRILFMEDIEDIIEEAEMEISVVKFARQLFCRVINHFCKIERAPLLKWRTAVIFKTCLLLAHKFLNDDLLNFEDFAQIVQVDTEELKFYEKLLVIHVFEGRLMLNLETA